MTVQALSTVFLEGKEHSLVNCTNLLRFEPRDHGIKAQYYTTAGHPGYDCSYEVMGGRLRLRDFETYNSDGEYPPLNGVEPELPRSKYHNCVWRDVGVEVGFTGVIALADCESFLEEYLFAPRKPLFFWERVIGVAFEGGAMTTTFDLSDVAARMRADYLAAESDHERMMIRRRGTWHFGMMEDVHDWRRAVVDVVYAPRFRREQEALLDSFYGRLDLGQPRRPSPWTYCPITYAPLGCESVSIEYDDFVAIADRFEAGKMVRGDAEIIGSFLPYRLHEPLGHLRFEADKAVLERIALLVHPAYDKVCSKPKVSCGVYHRLGKGEIAELRRLIDEAFGR